jgi:hypothetical protein
MSGVLDFVNSDLRRLACEIGATFTKPLTLRDTCSTAPIDLTGYTASMSVVDDEGTSVISLTTANGRITFPETTVDEETVKNTILLEIAASDTAELPAGQYKYALDLTMDDNVWRILTGAFEVCAITD